MPQARNTQISIIGTPYYHCMGRCVRKAFLCAEVVRQGGYSHRKTWIVDRLRELAETFTIDVCAYAYAVMSNHYHLVLRINADKSQQLGDGEINILWI